MPAEGPFPIGGWKPLLAGFRSEDAAVLIGLFRRRVAPFYPQSVIDNCFLIPMMAAAARWSDKQGYPHASLALIKELFTLPLTDMRTAKLLEELARLYHCRKISLSQINTLTRSLADFDHETGRRNTKAVAKICESLLTRFEITSLVDFARLPGLIMGIAFHLAGENPEEVAGRDLSTAVKLGKMVIETLPIKCEDKKIVRSVKNFIHLALTIDFEQGLELMHAAFEKQLFNRTNFNYLVKDFITLLEADSERFAKLVPRFIDAIIAEEPLTSEDRDFIAAEFSYLAQSYCGIVHDQSMHRENPKAAWIIYLALLRNPLLSDDARLHIEQNIIRAASSKNSVFTEAAALADLKPEESKYSAALIAHLIFSNRTHPNHADRCLAFIEASPFRSEAIFIGTILQAMNVKKQYREAIALADRFLASWQPQTYNEKRFIYLGVQRHKVKLLLSQAASNTNGHKADLLNEALGCFRMMMQYAETENLVSAFSAKTLMMGVETLDRLNRVPEAVEAAIKLAHDFPLFYPARDYLASHPISSRP
jgi:hypothetical protein